MATHPLQNTWVVWEHKQMGKDQGDEDWSNSMRDICEFGSVEDFWKYWSFIPRPSEVFFTSDAKKDVDGRIIDGFSVFKKGIVPDYCDPINREGSELCCRKYFNPDVLDIYWENFVLGLIGETIDEDGQICGCRVVDKSKNKPMYRLELWYRSKNKDVGERLRLRLLDALTDGEAAKNPRGAPEFSVKSH
mmetsp:Transcript_26931/g.27163  ORF Transcript_26931/g.27163 Transcript_26931/m.27163 type:complete len:190 (+) Transcript_26931:122-691(+)|eukprot:CAMPEP_0182427460 /NCGR_PEP_ID=MMETSP1167-20130531/17218_1 /TAXON_ID=2988 /ORGANISM="Mallomonas Sp, Strain CCMP3275" /LENGTH=189 /DNA_ID=CAMNT_0024609707 /DNA_START=115 /DNA_END=684 /DNA_ORIENTATION=+